MSSIFTKFRIGHEHKLPDTPPQTWPPGLLFRRWEGSKALPAGSIRGAPSRERVDFSLMAPRDSSKASKDLTNKSLVHTDPLQIAIALNEETEMAIHSQYLKTIRNEIHSSKSKATLAILARHFRLQRLNEVLIDIVEMQCDLERWHKKVKTMVPNDTESAVQNSKKKLEDVAKSLHKNWVTAKAIIEAQYCLKDGKHLETKIAQFHDSIEQTLVILFELAGKMQEASDTLNNAPEMPFTKLSVHKKIVELPGKYEVVE